MSDPSLLAELQRKIAENDAAGARLKQELDSQLAAYQQNLNNGQPDSNKLSARSQTTAGYAMATPAMSQASCEDRAPKRQRRAMSQQMSQQMSRTASNRSETGPFRQTGASLQPLPAPKRALPNAQRPQTTCSPSHDAMNMPDVGELPDVFLARFGSDQAYMSTFGANLSPLDFSNGMPASKCPSMVSGWSAGEGLTPMTRQNSFFGDNTVAGVDMARWASGSQSSRGFLDEAMFSPGQQSKQPYFEQDFLGVGANLPADMARSFSSSMQSNALLLSSPEGSFDATTMERSQSLESTTSTKSNASSRRRHKEALDRVLKASQVTLAPKPQAQGEHKPRVAATGKKEGKVAVPKHTYQRRKPVKVFCNQCTEHPEGFRGDHELRRHVSAKHEGVVKKFICRDPTTVGIHTDLQVVKPLANCKQCRAGKPYGAYYNAAAHLRRQHFNPRTSRAKGKSEEKRGGKGGGDWPLMIDLKAWFEERRVPADKADAHDADQEEDGPDSVETDMDFDMEAYGLNDAIPSYDIGQFGDSTLMSMEAPASTAVADFELNQYVDPSSVQSVMLGLMDDGSQMYGSPFSAGNTATPNNVQDMGQLPLGEGPWTATI